jgi:hypothetical protein
LYIYLKVSFLSYTRKKYEQAAVFQRSCSKKPGRIFWAPFYNLASKALFCLSWPLWKVEVFQTICILLAMSKAIFRDGGTFFFSSRVKFNKLLRSPRMTDAKTPAKKARTMNLRTPCRHEQTPRPAENAMRCRESESTDLGEVKRRHHDFLVAFISLLLLQNSQKL